jgi:hypothetical protein
MFHVRLPVCGCTPKPGLSCPCLLPGSDSVIPTADKSSFHIDDGLPDVGPLVCPAAQIRTSSNDSMLHLLLDPLYYHFEGCVCSVHHEAVINYSNGAAIAMKCIDSSLPKVQWPACRSHLLQYNDINRSPLPESGTHLRLTPACVCILAGLLSGSFVPS